MEEEKEKETEDGWILVGDEKKEGPVCRFTDKNTNFFFASTPPTGVSNLQMVIDGVSAKTGDEKKEEPTWMSRREGVTRHFIEKNDPPIYVPVERVIYNPESLAWLSEKIKTANKK